MSSLELRRNAIAKPLSIGDQRLLQLAEFLETDPRVKEEGRFKMDIYWDAGGSFCDSAGCALGWAGVISQFRAAGYACDESGPAYDGLTFYDAADSFFGMARDDSFEMFNSSRHVDALQVAADIRRYVADRTLPND